MKFFAKALGLVSLALSIANASPLQKRDFGPVTIYTPPSNYTSDRSLYARSVMLTVNDVSLLPCVSSGLQSLSHTDSPSFPSDSNAVG